MAAVATDDADDGTKPTTSYRLRYTGAEDFDGCYTRLTAEIRSNPLAIEWASTTLVTGTAGGCKR